jgi:NAD(P)-dependent dehydrogenase (short-subunit alcohol dehydrogenase family)
MPTVNRIDLGGRRAVITGGAEGFGRAVAERFLRSGAAVSLWDVNRSLVARTAEELSRLGPVHHAVADISNHGEVERAVAAAVEALAGIDILIANAGLTGPNATTWEYPIDDWRRVVDVNLVGTFCCCRAVVPIMLAQNYGRIVTISSVAGKDGNPNASAYSAAKAGIIALTKSLGKELAAKNIAVNCVTPAAARTRIFAQMSEAHIQYMLSKIPRGRFLEVQELASLVAWLASEENSFSTGAVWDLSGGRSTY